MNDEAITVIDVALHQEKPVSESIQSNWISSEEAIHRSRLKNKSAFQRAIVELTNSHYFPKESLRRGEARNTQYSELAIAAILLLKTGKLEQLRELQQNSTPRSTSIVHVDRHNAISLAATAEADNNLITIDNQIDKLLSRFEELGEALGDRAASQIEAGFTRKVAQVVKKLTEI
jgi:hypothetical protein